MNIDEMPAGQELDFIMIDMMGWERDSGRVFNPSTSIADAWQVVAKIKESHRVCLMLEDYQFDGKYWEACFKGKFDESAGKWTKLDYAFADTPELAICRAALKVVTSE